MTKALSTAISTTPATSLAPPKRPKGSLSAATALTVIASRASRAA
jgi:hypothetical protein